MSGSLSDDGGPVLTREIIDRAINADRAERTQAFERGLLALCDQYRVRIGAVVVLRHGSIEAKIEVMAE